MKLRFDKIARICIQGGKVVLNEEKFFAIIWKDFDSRNC